MLLEKLACTSMMLGTTEQMNKAINILSNLAMSTTPMNNLYLGLAFYGVANLDDLSLVGGVFI